MKRHTQILLQTALISICIALFACGGEAPKSQPNTVSKKISVQKVQPASNSSAPEGAPHAAAAQASGHASAQQAPAEPTAGGQEAAGPAAPKPEEKSAALQPVSEKSSTAAPPVKEEKAEAAAPKDDPGAPPPSPGLDAGSAQPSMQAATKSEITSDLIKESLQLASSYDPSGRFDPFEPLFKAQTAEASGVGKNLKDKRNPQTPLERVALSQLKVTAIIRSAGGNRALVEDTTGKGYVVKKGTYIGMNAGRIIEIERDRIVIEEEVENLMGQLTLKNAELKLQKPAGEL